MGGTNLPLALLSTSPSYTFTMEPGLLLQANFIANPFLAAHGRYQGLIAPAAGFAAENNIGSFNLMVTTTGVFSGDMHVGAQAVPLSGKFTPEGTAQSAGRGTGPDWLTTTLQLDFSNQSVTGTVSNANGSVVTQLSGYQNIYSANNPAANYAGRYSLFIAGTTNPAVGPYGTSYGTAVIKPSGAITFAGSLADGTPVSQSAVLLANGYWPLYLSLYGGKGSLLSWIALSTNETLTAPSIACWINSTNRSKTAGYRSGFTNQSMDVYGGLYTPEDQPLLLLTNAQLSLVGSDLALAMTNQLTVSSYFDVIFNNPTNGMTVTVNANTGIVTGSFPDPSVPTKIIPLNGLVGPGQQGAAGYFPGQSQSGMFSLISN